ncbi:hypothetical protein [Nitrosospira sp. Nsp1]|uniref:hypothetical protein n=1 Tax=Nitrosospira sp. Nsp1 TaxID=136547 RepID=UPI000B81C8F9|nr:hypothetical protein [Nitrosospira sp. Nsp1]
MCELQEIRYVHHMAHPKYPNVLEVGSSCAADMEEDVSAAKKREKTLAKRAVWGRGWKQRLGGGLYKVFGGCVVEVYMRDQRWTVTILTAKETIQKEKEFHRAKDSFEAMVDAQLYAFDYIYPLKVEPYS